MSTQPDVKSFSVTDTNGNPLRLTVSTDIVDYMDSARTFGREDMADVNVHGRFQRRLIAIPDRKADVVTPMVLSIGNNNGLYLVRKENSAAGDGWKLIDLGASFEKILGAKPQVRALDAAWTDDDRIAVAVAVDNGDGTTPSRVFVAYDLSSKTDWNNIAWADCGTRGNVRVTGIRVLDEGDGNWTVVLDGDAGRVDTLYLLRSKQPRPFNQALVFNPAVDYQEVFDFDVVVDPFVGSGIAVLGQSGRDRVLSFRPFPRYGDDGRLQNVPPAVPLPCPPEANVLGAGLTRNGGTDLYVGGQGVHMITADDFDNQDDATLVPVMSTEAASNVRQLAIADAADGSVAVWGLLQNGHLVVVKRTAGANGSAGWGTPLRLRNGVQEIAPVHGDRHAKTSLLVVYTDGTAAILLQDASTGVWRESPLLVANPKEVAKVSCYGTAVRVLADGGMPQATTKVKVSASVLTSVILNNRNVFIGPDLEVEVETDPNGGVHLYDRARSLTPSVYRFTIAGIGESIDVNPAGGIHERFSAMTGNELRNATVPTANGGATPLLPDEFRTGAKRDQVDGMASALNQAATLATKTTSGPIAGVSQTRAGTAFSSTLKLQAVPDNYQWGIQADANGVRLAPQSVIDKIVSVGVSIEHFFVDLGDSIADFFEGLWERITEGWTFVVRKVQDAFEFICALGDKIKKFVLTTLEEIGSFFTWLWDQVKTGLEKLWNFLKFIFDWDDILIARDVMVNATDEALKYLKTSTGMLKDKTREGFDYAIAEIRKWQTQIGVPPAKLPPPTPGTSFSSEFKKATSPAQNLLDQATGNSVIGWVLQRLDSVLDEIVHIEGPNPGKVAADAAKNFLTGLVDDEYNDLIGLWNQLQADVVKIFDGKMPAANELSFETIKNLIVAVGAGAVVGLLTMLRDLVVRTIDLLASMIDVMHAALFVKISFPFIEKLVELVAPGAHLDTSFRLVDALMLLVSIPATITYKLIFNTAPFTRGQQINLPFGRVSVQSSAGEVFAGFVPYAGIAGAFFKMAKGIWASGWAMVGDFTVSKIAIIGGVAFGAIGLAAQVFGRYEQEGDVVSALEWTGIGAASFAVVVSVATAVAKWNDPITDVVPDSYKLDAGVDLVSTVAQVALGAAIFGVLIDKLRKSSIQYDQVRQMPESFRWIALVFDQAGTILTDVATMLPLAAAEVKLILIGIGATVKGGSLVYKVLEVVSTKLELEPLRT